MHTLQEQIAIAQHLQGMWTRERKWCHVMRLRVTPAHFHLAKLFLLHSNEGVLGASRLMALERQTFCLAVMGYCNSCPRSLPILPHSKEMMFSRLSLAFKKSHLKNEIEKNWHREQPGSSSSPFSTKRVHFSSFSLSYRFHLIDRTKSGTFWPRPEKKNDVTHSE